MSGQQQPAGKAKIMNSPYVKLFSEIAREMGILKKGANGKWNLEAIRKGTPGYAAVRKVYDARKPKKPEKVERKGVAYERKKAIDSDSD